MMDWRGETQVNLFTTRPVKTPFVFIDGYLISWPIYCDCFISCPPPTFLLPPLYNFIFNIHRKIFGFFCQGGFSSFYSVFKVFVWIWGALFSNEANELSLPLFPIFFSIASSIGFWRNLIGYIVFG